jgi:hypothetical protein
MTTAKHPKRPWTDAERELLRSIYPECHTADIAALLDCSVERVYNQAHLLGLNKSADYLASETSARIQRGKQHPNMVANRFQKGQRPWNTGMKGWSPVGSQATQFKPGSVSPNRQEFGALRINSTGEIDIKLFDGLRAWKQLSHYVWFLHHGHWPPHGHCLRHKDGDTHNPAIENLQLITRRENMRLNSVHTNYPPELARLVQLRGALNRQVNQRRKALTQKPTKQKETQ